MPTPIRYKEVVDFFEGLQVLGELSEQHTITFKKVKSKNSLHILVKTSLGPLTSYTDLRRFHFHSDVQNKKDDTAYFAFTLTLERNEDVILLHSFLPGATENHVYGPKKPLQKMYENSLILDLKKVGFKDAKINDTSGMGLELFCTAGPDITFESISKLYRLVKSINVRVFNAIRR